MTSYSTSKINQLLKRTPRGVVLTTPWLAKHKISTKLAWWSEKAGWFERIANGAYKLVGDTVAWSGAIVAIQQQLQLPVHVGAKTALQLLGKSHYLNYQLNEITLFVSSGTNTSLPAWLRSSNYWNENFISYCPNLFSQSQQVGLINHEIESQSIVISSPERALFELCYLVPTSVSFEEAALIAENLSHLRPSVVQLLLEGCRSVKVKRLVLYFADYFQHQWLTELNIDRISLGKGKRCIAEGGCYNAKYQLSVPPIKAQ